MWLLSLLPDTLIHAVLLLGILGVIISLALNVLPFVAKYRAAIQVIASILILIGAWLEGGRAMQIEYDIKEMEMKVKIAELEKQIAESEKKAIEATNQIEYVYRDKVKVVKDVQVVIQEKIRDVAVNIDSQCKLSSDVIDILNTSAKNVKPVGQK